MKHTRIHILLIAVLLMVVNACGSSDGEAPRGIEGAECYANLTCNPGLECSGGICVPQTSRGSLGNPCYSNNTCNPGLLCEAGTCVPGTDIETGTEGGLCYDNGTCNAGLRCDQGLCVDGKTAVGAQGGACYPNDTCDPGLVCDRGICVTGDIETGSLDAPCWPNGTCNTGLKCQNNICVEDTPEAGEQDGPCYPNNTCDTGLSCVNGLCQAIGALGQECYPNNTCNAGLRCVDGLCEELPQTDGDVDCEGCVIDGECIPAQSPHPEDACAWCDPGEDDSAYSPRPAGFECRRAEGECDQAEVCNGEEMVCPADGFKDNGAACGDDTVTECNAADYCDGNGVCLKGLKAAGESCGSDISTECDGADTCDGNGVCVVNYQPWGAACGDPAFSDCNDPDFCDGLGACLENLVSEGSSCGSFAQTECDLPDTCDAAGECLPNYVDAGNGCGSDADTVCDNPDTCDGVGLCVFNYESAGTWCWAADDRRCDAEDHCNGRGRCEDEYLASGAPCDDAQDCTRQDVCDGQGAGDAFCSGEAYSCGTGTCNPADDFCSCPPGYQGDFCNVCAPPYQDNDENGTCLPGCDHQNAPVCDPAAFLCRDDSGIASCVENTFGDIPADTYFMGSPPDEPGRHSDEDLHQVEISRGLVIMRTEVTQALWTEIATEEGWGTAPSFHGGCDECPVERISWYEALAFANAMSRRHGLPECYRLSKCAGEPGNGCGSVSCTGEYHCSVTVNAVHQTPYGCPGYRLPTEAEWELVAAAGGEQAFYPTAGYDGALTDPDCDDPHMERIGWYCGNAGNTSHPVAGKSATGQGVYDMAGNVREWVWDTYGNYGSDSVDPQGADMGVNRIVRGGGFSDTAATCRAASRTDAPPTERNSVTGFRLVRTIEPDMDGRDSFSDNCPGVPNPEQYDWDANGVGDMCDDYVRIEAGTFIMGSPDGNCLPDNPDCDVPPPAEPMRQDDETPHMVTLSRPFIMASHEVTQDEWNVIAADRGFDPCLKIPDEPSVQASCGEHCPVESVNLYEILRWLNAKSRQDGLPECYRLRRCDEPYCGNRMVISRNGYDSIYECPGWRLPTEAEWEYAARAGSYTAFYPTGSGDGSMSYYDDGVNPREFSFDEQLEQLGWYSGNATVFYEDALTCKYCEDGSSYCDEDDADLTWNCGKMPVGLKEPNAWGLYDMLGNLLEYVWDIEMDGEEYGPDAVTDPENFDREHYLAYRRLRGGAYFAYPHQNRSAIRFGGMSATGRMELATFRPVKTFFERLPPVVKGEKSTSRTHPRWNWEIPEAADELRFRVDGGEWQYSTVHWYHESDTSLAMGEHVFEIQARYGDQWTVSAMFTTYRESFRDGYFSDVRRDLGVTPYGTPTAIMSSNVFDVTDTPESSLGRTRYYMRIHRENGADIFEMDLRRDTAGQWRVAGTEDTVENAAFLLELLKADDVVTDDRPLMLEILEDDVAEADFAGLMQMLVDYGYAQNGKPVYVRIDADDLATMDAFNAARGSFNLNSPYMKLHAVFSDTHGADAAVLQVTLANLSGYQHVGAYEFSHRMPNLHAQLAYVDVLGPHALLRVAPEEYYDEGDHAGIVCAALRDEVEGFLLVGERSESPISDDCRAHAFENNGLIYAKAEHQDNHGELLWYGDNYDNSTITPLVGPSAPSYSSYSTGPWARDMLTFNAVEGDAVPFYDARPSTNKRGYLVSVALKFASIPLAQDGTQMIVAKTDTGGFGLSVVQSGGSTNLRYTTYLACDNDYDIVSYNIDALDPNALHWLIGSYSYEDYEGFRLWIDGVEVATRRRSCYIGNNSSPVVLGADPNGWTSTRYHFDGMIKQVKVIDWEE